MRGLQQQCRFADTRVPAYQYQRTRHDSAAENAIELADSRQNTRLLITFYIYDGLGFFFTMKNRAAVHPLSLDYAFCFFNHAVPSLAARAFAEPLRRLITALGAVKLRFGLSHNFSFGQMYPECHLLKNEDI
ncbi:hypothetical protein D3C71_1619770 [compost metagenome]